MQIAHISDCHVVGPGRQVSGRVDTRRALQDAIDVIAALPRRPDILLATGDLTDNGTEEEYASFREIVEPLGLPVIPVVGNHDARHSMMAAFSSHRFQLYKHFFQYTVDDYEVRVLVIDSVTPGEDAPAICDDRLSWIRSQLAGSSQPTIIAMHYPPFATNIGWMEPPAKDWAQSLQNLVCQHRNVVRILCGHIHRPMTALWGGTCVMTAPSTAHQVFPDFTSQGRPRFCMEAPGVLLHAWDGANMLSTGISVPGLLTTFEP